MIRYFNILTFVISLSNFNNFLFEEKVDASISHNIARIAKLRKTRIYCQAGYTILNFILEIPTNLIKQFCQRTNVVPT